MRIKEEDIAFGLFLLLMVSILVGIIYMAVTADERAAERCAELSAEIGRPTEYIRGACYVELCEGYWVRKEDVIYSLDVCAGERKGEK